MLNDVNRDANRLDDNRPVANWAGLQLAAVVTVLFEKGGVFAGLIYGGIYSAMVVLGIHHGMVPVLVQGITTQGFNYISPASGSANMAQAGAAFGVWLKSKNPKTKTIAASATIAAVTGVTEPAIYGINFKFKKPFMAAAIGRRLRRCIRFLLRFESLCDGRPVVPELCDVHRRQSEQRLAGHGGVCDLVYRFRGTDDRLRLRRKPLSLTLSAELPVPPTPVVQLAAPLEKGT